MWKSSHFSFSDVRIGHSKIFSARMFPFLSQLKGELNLWYLIDVTVFELKLNISP